MATGVTVHDGVIADYNKFKDASDHNRFMIFKIDDGKIVLDGNISADDNYQNFLTLFPEDDCRYAIYKKDYSKDGMSKQQKLVLLFW
jgi:major membrane immunogen (membrane-anchored lipoprotein)